MFIAELQVNEQAIFMVVLICLFAAVIVLGVAVLGVAVVAFNLGALGICREQRSSSRTEQTM